MYPRLLFLVICLLSINLLLAEGSRELAPNQTININGNLTNDIAALHINSPSYNFFASYTNPNPENRLNINIQDPTAECIYLGFSVGHQNFTGQNPPLNDYEWRLVDPNGNVVFGPVIVNQFNADITSWSEAVTGPAQIHGSGGYTAVQIDPSDLTSQGWTGEGDYYIQFDNRTIAGGAFLIDYWDISVANCSGAMPIEKPGRIWSFNWAFFAINDFGFPERPFNGAFYVCAPDPADPDAAYITKIDFDGAGFRPAAFNIAFNSFGSQNTGDIAIDRRSLENMNGTQPEYKIYLNDPVDLCDTGGTGQIDLLGITRCNTDEWFIKFTTTKEGQIDLLLDLDGNDNIYTPGTADVIITKNVTTDEVGIPSCVLWDGKDGLGNSLAEDTGTEIPVVLSYAQGVFHFPIYDAEYLTEGFQVTAVRPSGPDPLLYYDDTNISQLSGSGEPQLQLAGCVLPCHRWTNYTLPDFVGFGNLNTINSWWFSQQITTSELLFMPSYYECNIEGPDQICEGTTSQLILAPQLFPDGADPLNIIGISWSGPGITTMPDLDTISITAGGTYTAQLEWLTQLGDTCRTTCSVFVEEEESYTTQIDTFINLGDTLTINGSVYTQETVDTQYFSGQNGCDSLVIIDITVIQTGATALQYHLDDCNSLINSGDNADYSEFIPSYPTPLICGELDATVLFRENSLVNIHSCTPGVNNSPAMCVGSNDDCTYDANSDKAVIFEVTVDPDMGRTIAISGLEFYERSPQTFDWIGGASGPNNYPTLYAVRVLKDGTEIFRQADIPTSELWTLESFDFMNNSDFTVDQSTVFRFELMGYCTIGNGASVNAWDLDEFTLRASCLASRPYISGRLIDLSGEPLDAVEVRVSTGTNQGSYRTGFSNELGAYAFSHNHIGESYTVKPYDNEDMMEGLSTLDILYLRAHLTGSIPFNSPYQMIAGDLDRSNSISTLDIIELRKLLLGMTTELKNNTSWRFGATSVPISFQNPWKFKEYEVIPNLYNNVEKLDFIGVKVGDVSGSSRPTAAHSAVFRTDKELNLTFELNEEKSGSTRRIDFRAKAFNEISGMQFALLFQEAEIQDLIPGKIEGIHYAISHDDPSILRVIWDTDNPKDIDDDDLLFSVLVDQSGSIRPIYPVQLLNAELSAEAYAGQNWNPVLVRLTKKASEDNLDGFNLSQNRPNPFSNSTVVEFRLPHEEDINLEVRNLAGSLIYQVDGKFGPGNHLLTIDHEDLGYGNGVYIYSLTAGKFFASKRMIIME